MLPAPHALRLVSAARPHAEPRVPFGLAGWSEEARAVAVLLDIASDASVAAACEQIPDPGSLADGTLVVLLGERPAAPSLLGRLWGMRRPPIPRAIRATALLARGFVGIAAAVDPESGADLVWGYAAATGPC